jgi:hypothetical protein
MQINATIKLMRIVVNGEMHIAAHKGPFIESHFALAECLAVDSVVRDYMKARNADSGGAIDDLYGVWHR